MSLLPPAGWSDVATKTYVSQKIDAAKHEIVNTVTWRMFATMVGFVGVVAGVVAAFVAPLY
jgi:hypothetical protein